MADAASWPGVIGQCSAQDAAMLTAVSCVAEEIATERLVLRAWRVEDAESALAIYGEHSPFLSTAQFLTENLPQCRTAIIPGAKHRAPEENPEPYVQALKAFFDGSRQREPELRIRSMALTIERWMRHGRPLPCSGGNRSAISSQCSSLIS